MLKLIANIILKYHVVTIRVFLDVFCLRISNDLLHLCDIIYLKK